jgi:hypothetical protein
VTVTHFGKLSSNNSPYYSEYTMNIKDATKILRLEKEIDYMNVEFIEEISLKILNNLKNIVNEKIFNPKNGELTYEIKVFSGRPNARAIIYTDKPFNPKIELELSLLIEIYRDSFTFPLFCKRIEKETNAIENLHMSHSAFTNASFTFNTGIPEVHESFISSDLIDYCIIFGETVEQANDSRIDKNDVNCRFLMFELMLIWTFFHELGHIVQQHYLLNEQIKNIDTQTVEISEINYNVNHETNLKGQAREILADVQAVDFTFFQLWRTNRLKHIPFYFLLCSMECMFQRFYGTYNEDLELTQGKHPHPVIRSEIAIQYSLRKILEIISITQSSSYFNNINEFFVYYSVRASVLTGYFRAYRIEEFDGTSLPSFMKLQTEPHNDKKLSYISALINEVRNQAPAIQAFHLAPTGSIESLLSYFPD